MNKFTITISIICSVFLFHNDVIAESKIANKIFGSRDCSQYSTKTFSGLAEYARCKKGLPPSKNFLKDLEFKKKDKSLTQKKLNCNDYTTKTFTGLVNKMKCKREKK